MTAISIISLFMALGATVCAFIFITPEKKRPGMGKFMGFLHDTLTFKYLLIEKIMQALYIFSTAFVIMMGFCMLFYVYTPDYYGYYDYYGYSSMYGSYYSSEWYGGYGLLIMFLGPIGVRFSYEIFMLPILLIKNVMQINNKMKSEGGEATSSMDLGSVLPTKAAEPAPAANNYCLNCGQELLPSDQWCPKCGTSCNR